MADASKKTRVDRYIDRFKNNRIISILMVVAITVIAVGSFTSALSRIGDFFSLFNTGVTQIDFHIRGDIIIEEFTGLPKNVAVKVLWLDAAGEDRIMQSPEIDYIDPSSGRLDYELSIRNPAQSLFRREDGIIAAVGGIVAFVDGGHDGTLEQGVDKIIAWNNDKVLFYIEGEYEPEDEGEDEDEIAARRQMASITQGYSVRKRTLDSDGDISYDDIIKFDGTPTIDLYFSKDTSTFLRFLNEDN